MNVNGKLSLVRLSDASRCFEFVVLVPYNKALHERIRKSQMSCVELAEAKLSLRYKP